MKYQQPEESQFQTINDQLGEHILELLEMFDIKYARMSNQLRGSCPIHRGDNESAFCVYVSRDFNYPVNWHCYTHSCERVFGAQSLGLVQAILSSKKGWRSCLDDKLIVPLEEVIKFISSDDTFDIEKLDLLSDDEIERQNFCTAIHSFTATKKKSHKGIHRSIIRKNLVIPSPYFVSRGFSSQILNAFDVGDCIKTGKTMFERAVANVFTEDGYYIGCSGRSIHEKCPKCNGFHNPQSACRKSPKWLHQKGFRSKDHLYGFEKAIDYINDTRTIVLCEGPGDVWKMAENGVNNAVALFGTSLSQSQKILINSTFCLNVIIFLDNDGLGKAGDVGAKRITRELDKMYNTKIITPPAKDLGECTKEQAEELTNKIKMGFWC